MPLSKKHFVRTLTSRHIGTILLCVLTMGAVSGAAPDELYQGFRNPPAQARPFVRWWWNGSCVTEEEILRELDVMKAAGVGGIEINPIAMPQEASPGDAKPLVWLSDEWNAMVRVAADGARQRGMIADLIVGTGWPFGGKFLAPGQTIQGITLNKKPLRGPGAFRSPVAELLKPPKTPYKVEDRPVPQLLFLWLVPDDARGVGDGADMMDKVRSDGTVAFDVPAGKHTLYIGTWQQSFRAVMWGGPGADGPVLDHYNRDAVETYLGRMSDELGPALGGKLGDSLRAMFCDSIELSGANWTGDLPAEFEKRRGYAPAPYLPLILDKDDPKNDGALADSVRRARYDFSKTLVELFHARFLWPFHHWCHEAGTLSRYQAYGHPWLMGMLDGYMAPDIPEGDTWLFNNWDPLDGIRYAVWNKYASSGAHLAGRPLVGCEAMTNTQGVFRAALEYVKQATDLSIITGINHFVLHGFNYSPPEAGFPGWVRYGTYFNEQNPWWPHFRKWADYCGRLSWVLQESRAHVQVAILGPTADVWSRNGLDRSPFVYAPRYLHLMWQAIHQNGCSADYVNRTVLEKATFAGGKVRFGPMAYDALIVTGAETLEPATAEAIRRYAQAGGKIAFVGQPPHRSAGLMNAKANDERVVRAMREARQASAERVVQVSEPKPDDLLGWAGGVLAKLDVPRSVRIDAPHERLYQVHHKQGDRDIFFLANLHRDEPLAFEAAFDAPNKTAWRWDPETGARSIFAPKGKSDTFSVTLEPLASLLLVFEPGSSAQAGRAEMQMDRSDYVTLSAPWNATFKHAILKTEFKRTFTTLADLAQMRDRVLHTFAGTVVYRTEFELPDAGHTLLDLGKVCDVSEVTLNGRPLGVRWWGRHVYDATEAVRAGRNVLEVAVTTTVFNYAQSLKDNATAARWTKGKKPVPTGLLGPVRCYRTK